jgi:uncharacterized membrane protein YtjA (UPF0391 family)
VLYYSLVFLLLALVAGMLGFGVGAFTAMEIAKICFFVLLVLSIASLVTHIA